MNGPRRVPDPIPAEAATTIEYAVRYTEHNAFDGREYLTTSPIGSSDHPDAAKATLERAARTREYQAENGLPVDAVAVTCTVNVTPWRPIEVAADV